MHVHNIMIEVAIPWEWQFPGSGIIFMAIEMSWRKRLGQLCLCYLFTLPKQILNITGFPSPRVKKH